MVKIRKMITKDSFRPVVVLEFRLSLEAMQDHAIISEGEMKEMVQDEILRRLDEALIFSKTQEFKDMKFVREEDV